MPFSKSPRQKITIFRNVAIYVPGEFVALTDNPEEWLKENNEQRIGDGNDPEELNDFEIFEVDLWLYNKENL